MKVFRMLIAIFFSLSILSCNQRKPSSSIDTSHQSVVNEKLTNGDVINEERKSLPDGVHYGKVEPYIGKNQMEKNIMSQINTYQKALFRGDIDGASSYLYPDAITYFRKHYPKDFTDKDIIKSFYKDMSETLVKMGKEYKNHGIDIEMLVCDIDRIIETEKAILCVFGLTMQMYNESAKGEKYIHVVPTKDDYTVSVSFNNGKNWYFLALNDETPNILRLKFSNDIITKVMGY